MQIRYQFIGDLDMIIVDKALGAPNLPLSSLYGRYLLFDLVILCCLHVFKLYSILHSVSLLCCVTHS